MIVDSIKTKAGENYLTEKEEKTLFGFVKSIKGKQAERDFCLLKLCRLCGLRRGEVLALSVGHVRSLSRIKMIGITEKNGAKDDVVIPAEMQSILERFLRLKRKWREDVSDDAPLFISKKGGRMAIRTFNDLMSKWCALAGIPIYTPHALRHTKAQRIMKDRKFLSVEEQAKALLLVNRQLRHRTMSSTKIYTQPTKEEMMVVAGI